MATFTWNTGSGAFNVGSDWTPLGPPGSGDVALFNLNSGTISGTGTVATLNVAAGGPWVFTAGITASFIYLNTAATLSGTGVWMLTGSATNGNYIIVANGAGTTGNLTVSGGGKITSTQAANTNSFSLYVGGGGSATGANGTLTVTGAGSSVNTGLNGAAVGETGTGLLDIEAGGTATFASSNSTAIAALGVGRAGTGTVKVSGAGSTVTVNGFVYIGRQGKGTLLVDQGGTFTGGAAASSPGGSETIVIGDGSPTLDANGNPNNPVYYGGSGSAQVLHGSTLHSLGGLRVGYRGTAGSLLVDNSSLAYADGQVLIGSAGTDRAGAVGTLTLQGGGTVRSGATQSNGNAGLDFGNDAGTSGVGTVSGVGSTLSANGYRLTVGANGSGSLTISNGGKATSGASYSDLEAALAVAGGVGSTGSLTITGAGSQFIAAGDAVIGGNEKGAGPVAGGTGTVTVTAGGLLQTAAMYIEPGATVTVDASSTLTATSVTLAGGTLSLAALSSASPPITFGTDGTLDVGALSGATSITSLAVGDKIDLIGQTGLSLNNNTITTATGSLTVNAAATGSHYSLVSDGSGGTVLALNADTIGVYRFFDSSTGTHFFTASQTEAQSLMNPSSPGYRPDLKEETNGFGAIDPAAPDPNEVTVYRFFDTVHGTHFFTASAAEANGLMDPSSSTYRPDLTPEPNASFLEDGAQVVGDVPVYRFFDSVYGTHFYTGDQNEYAAITTPGTASYRPDLVSEGIGFYAPAGSYT